jgi:nucleoside-diphosphate-sugar epimerase
MNIGVLGSSGYLGNNIVHALEGKHKVISLSLRKNCRLDQLYVGNWGSRDIDRAGMEVLVVCTSPDAKTCNEEPVGTLKLVLVDLERFLRVAAGCGLKKIVYLSTCRVYEGGEKTITEKASITHKDIYSLSHLAGESMLRDLCLSQGVSGACFRLSNVFGTHTKINRDSPMWRLAANSFIYDIACKRSIDIRTPQAMRDFVPVSVVIKAVKNYLESKEMNRQFDIINIASGFTLSMLEARDIVVQIESKTLTECLVGAELERIRNKEDTRRIIDPSRAKILGLYKDKDIYNGYVRDTILTLGIARREYLS